MSKTIFFLVKVFDSKEYVEQFIKGTLFANRISYFQEIEESESSNRADKSEGIVSWHQPDQITLKLGGCVLNNLAGPVSIRMNRHNSLNIFCLFAAHSGEIKSVNESNIELFKKQLGIPSDCLKLGKYAVIITNVIEFQNRFIASAKKENYGLQAGLVKYYNPEIFHGFFDEETAVFNKRDEFKHQNEYRIALDVGFIDNNPVSFEIGDLSDIAISCKTIDINKFLSVNIKS